MLYKKDGKWALKPYLVRYVQHGKEFTQHTDDKQWWLDFAELWDHTKAIGFEDVRYSPDQIERLKDVQSIGEGYKYYAGRYVVDGLFPDQLDGDERLDDHPLKAIQLQAENARQGQALTDNELEAIMQGWLLTDMEIRLLSMEVGVDV